MPEKRYHRQICLFQQQICTLRRALADAVDEYERGIEDYFVLFLPSLIGWLGRPILTEAQRDDGNVLFASVFDFFEAAVAALRLFAEVEKFSACEDGAV